MGSVSTKIVQEYASHYSRRTRISGEWYDKAKYLSYALIAPKTLVGSKLRKYFHILHVDPEDRYWNLWLLSQIHHLSILA